MRTVAILSMVLFGGQALAQGAGTATSAADVNAPAAPLANPPADAADEAQAEEGKGPAVIDTSRPDVVPDATGDAGNPIMTQGVGGDVRPKTLRAPEE